MHNPDNYRGLSIMAVLPKLYASILTARVQSAAESEGWRASTQAGFREGARLEDNLLILGSVLQHAAWSDRDLFVMYVDLTKAYDSIDRARLW